jgi:hypothetical protein
MVYLVAVGAVHDRLGVRKHGGAGRNVSIVKDTKEIRAKLTSESSQGT